LDADMTGFPSVPHELLNLCGGWVGEKCPLPFASLSSPNVAVSRHLLGVP
jgi:hypothetical protein